ncbi:hypothetical protein [Parageobacillus thermoglucosidasius]|uniref:hypothetical protein n=1 Tax=Parageobacillus thermoglucosidasius TaxID=1426 RepID=UPI00162882E1|nr:hypothetical protein [Parageobacillus thermoglucosidasius]
MNICFTASRLMKASEVRRFCQQARENQALLQEEEKKRKETVQTLLQKEKTTSAPTLAV